MLEIFKLPEKIPSYRKQIALYRTTELKTLSPRESTVARYFNKRINSYREAFSLKQEPVDRGDTFAFEEEEIEFEAYKASDSFWWTHNKLAFRESLDSNAKLPDEKTAIQKAEDYLARLPVDLSYAKFNSVTYAEIIHDDPKGNEIKQQNTAININFSFAIDDTEIVGPGAKIKVSFCDEDKISNAYYFWRNTMASDEMDCISPDEALDKFLKDPRFIRLNEKTDTVKLNDIKLNYYALPPFEFQRYLIPVYSIKGSANTDYLEKYDFTSHVLAVKLSSERIKKAGIIANPNSCQIFE